MSPKLQPWRFPLLVAIIVSIAGGSAAASVAYTYDQNGRLNTAHYDNGICVTYSYDPNGNRTAQTNLAVGSPPPATWGSSVWGCFNWTP
jgi:YD repeat-containing protein